LTSLTHCLVGGSGGGGGGSHAVFARRRKLPEDDAPADDSTTLEPSVLQVLGAAAVQGRTALGLNAGAYVPRLGRGSLDGGGEFRRGKLCADIEGFSLHAGVCIPGYARERLEQLCR
jgi:hypothetical protein